VTFHPQLTIGIPTVGSRPDRLAKAVASALGQSTPAYVLISDQCAGDEAEKAVAPFRNHPLFRYTRSPAKCLWENWTHAVDTATTPLFAWLQDDDVISPHFARRIYHALNVANPDAAAWIARLGISVLDGMANWWQGTGPMIPMDLLNGGLTVVPGSLMAAASFFTSFALSPAVAFRLNDAGRQAVHNCPTNSDLFVERIILAELGRLGEIACDPAIVGYWRHHETNESRKQVHAGQREAPFRVIAEHVDRILANVPGWTTQLEGWLRVIGADNALRLHVDTPKVEGVPALDLAMETLRRITGPPVVAPTEAVPQHAEDVAPRLARKAVKVR